MSKIKHVFRNFSYYECDEMARYLEYMSLKGWHFKRWRIGMEFEQGEPKEVCYDVQAFPKGDEFDMKPSEDALDYSEYCKEAGWELVDVRGKFCVFQKIQDDAMEIVSPDEKLENIKQAIKEEASWLIVSVAIFLISAFLWGNGMRNHIFDNEQFLIMITCMVISLYISMKAAISYLHIRNHNRELKCGKIPFYGNRKQRYTISSIGFDHKKIAIVLGFIGGIVLCGIREDYILMHSVICAGVAIIITYMITLLLRPSGKSVKKNAAIGAYGIWMAVLLICFIVGLALGIDYDIKVDEKDIAKVQSELPLTLSDLGIDSYILKSYNKDGDSYGFGFSYSYELYYDQDVNMTYCVDQCSYHEILKIKWSEKVKDMKDLVEDTDEKLEDVTRQWGAREAYYDGLQYCIRYPEKIVELEYSDGKLTDSQIKVIREKLDL
ncbi:MAG: DUF2812 domain-containing protein [Lachnospiraceae bacterium]|nr:DUF2812 domain-containing protein [Lachnospiraceae bacterium]